jgi:hypothetical protein
MHTMSISQPDPNWYMDTVGQRLTCRPHKVISRLILI